MIKCRHYEPDTDWERLIALLAAAWTPSGPQTIWHIGDVSWWVRRTWETVLPMGFSLRHFAGQEEIEARIGVNNAVWTGNLVTPDRYSREG